MSQDAVTSLALPPPVSWKRAALSRVMPDGAVRGLAAAARGARAARQLVANLLYDAARYRRWSSLAKAELSREQLTALVTLNYHRIEKGLALPAPRPGFGADAVRTLITLLDQQFHRFGPDDAARSGIATLAEYQAFNRGHGIAHAEVDAALARYATMGAAPPAGEPCGGTRAVERATVLATLPADPESFFGSRHSVRHFSGEPVGLELIERAVRMAQRTPSVCNRQPWKAYAFTDPEQRKNLLSFQNGNRGFGDGAAQLLVVTSDLQHFTSVGERYQGWIDGGLFAMSLVHALHALGLGACMLNWSVTRETDAAMRAAAGIPDSELVIMMVAVGHLPERLRVAFSARKPLSDVLVVR